MKPRTLLNMHTKNYGDMIENSFQNTTCVFETLSFRYRLSFDHVMVLLAF